MAVFQIGQMYDFPPPLLKQDQIRKHRIKSRKINGDISNGSIVRFSSTSVEAGSNLKAWNKV